MDATENRPGHGAPTPRRDGRESAAAPAVRRGGTAAPAREGDYDRLTLRAGRGMAALGVLFCGCLFVQLFIGADPLVIALCAMTLIITFLPVFLLGRDLYTIFCVIFGLRYTGVALLAKTFYGEPLDGYLGDPLTAFFLTLVILSLYVASILAVRAADDRSIHPAFPPLSPDRLHLLALLCLVIGGCANLVVGLNKSTLSTEESHGALFVTAASLSTLFYAGLAAEAIATVHRTSRRTFVSPTLIGALAVVPVLTALTNTRDFFVNSVVTAFVTAYLYGSIRRPHVVAGGLVIVLFIGFISPVTLFVRANKEGLRTGEMIDLISETTTRAISEPSFYARIWAIQSMSGLREDGGITEYNYFENNSNVLNRLSYVALIDHIYDGIRYSQPIGPRAFGDLVERSLPGFMIRKRNINYQYTDFLAWQIGIEETDSHSAINFSLPMEGLAVWGALGLPFYTALVPAFILWSCSRFASFRVKSVMSLTLFALYQHLLVESALDGYLRVLTRSFPITVISMMILYRIVAPRPSPATGGGRPALTAHGS